MWLDHLIIGISWNRTLIISQLCAKVCHLLDKCWLFGLKFSLWVYLSLAFHPTSFNWKIEGARQTIVSWTVALSSHKQLFFGYFDNSWYQLSEYNSHVRFFFLHSGTFKVMKTFFLSLTVRLLQVVIIKNHRATNPTAHPPPNQKMICTMWVIGIFHRQIYPTIWQLSLIKEMEFATI